MTPSNPIPALQGTTLLKWARDARPGERVCYFAGNLAVERDEAEFRQRQEEPVDLRAAIALRNAEQAMVAARYGTVVLIQMREGEGCDAGFRYCAVRTRKPMPAALSGPIMPS